MRIGLSTDFGRSRCAPGPSAFSLPVALDGPCGCSGGCGCASDGEEPPPDTGDLPVLTLRKRGEMYMTEAGNPRWEWEEVLSGPAITYEQRTEVNDVNGQVKVVASATMAFDGEVAPAKETAVAWQGDVRWSITSLVALPGRLELKLERIDGP